MHDAVPVGARRCADGSHVNPRGVRRTACAYARSVLPPRACRGPVTCPWRPRPSHLEELTVPAPVHPSSPPPASASPGPTAPPRSTASTCSSPPAGPAWSAPTAPASPRCSGSRPACCSRPPARVSAWPARSATCRRTSPSTVDQPVDDVPRHRRGAAGAPRRSRPAPATRRDLETVGDDWDVEERAVAELDRLGLPADGPRPAARRAVRRRGRSGSGWPGCCCAGPTCCSSTSRPTTSTPTPRARLYDVLGALAAHRCSWSATTASCSSGWTGSASCATARCAGTAAASRRTPSRSGPSRRPPSRR